MNIKRIFHTVKYMNCRQICYRFRYEIVKRIHREIKFKRKYNINNNYIFNNKKFDLNNYHEIIIEADAILSNKFTFLNNLSYEFGNEIEWSKNPFNYRLWTFNLNYFDYLEVLYKANIITNDDTYLFKGIELITDWVNKNKLYNIDTWDPYVVSKRVYNIINFISIAKNKILISNLDEINDSIYDHAKYLEKNIEYYLDANHVIMDGKGLVFSGVYLANEKIIDKGLSILLNEYHRQVLSDGCHYERSPSYQVEVLSHYVECYLLLHKNNIVKEIDNIKIIIEKMTKYLSSIIMPDGNIPLLNDSSLDYPFKADDLLQVSSAIINKKYYYSDKISNYAKKILDEDGLNVLNILRETTREHEAQVLEESGYYIITDKVNEEDIYILFDCGDGGPDYNLGHCHADSMNIIFNVGGENLIIDSGTYTYNRGYIRDFYRSTLAHNTITIDNKNSSDIWGAFRVGKRAKSYMCKYVKEKDYTYIKAYHDGYTKVLKKDKIIHQREVIYIHKKAIFIVDSLLGNIKHSHNAILNFNISKENFDSKNLKMITKNNEFVFSINKSFTLESSKYSNEFEKQKECLSIKSSWKMSKEDSVITAILFNNMDLDIKVNSKYITITKSGSKIIQINR